MEGQVIRAFLQGHDPSVQQIPWSSLLATEVVDQQHAPVCLHLQRGLIVAASLLVDQVEFLEQHLTAYSDNWTANPDPALVSVSPTQGRIVVPDVVDHIIHLDHFVSCLHSVWDVQGALKHQSAYGFTDSGLAIAWRTEQEDGSPGVHCGSQVGRGHLVNHQMG